MGCKEVGRRLGLLQRRAGERLSRRRRATLLEALEDRTLMATAGSDYVIKSGFQWDNPSRITYSFAPDGVPWISGANALNATFDAKFGRGAWQREVARALATWQSVANINIVPVGDGPYRVNALGASQGDARFGDIRIGATAISGNQQTLAQTYFPPPQGSSAGGDVELNLNMNYSIGTDFDLFSVVLHETGHSLGLDHPSSGKVVMRPVYGGVVTTLDEGDIVGIQSIYGARRPDVYEAQGYGISAQRPIDLTSVLATTQVATASAASLDRIGDVQWFSFVAPSYAAGSWQVTASASNSSMLSPKVMVYDAAGSLLAQASQPGKWSADATASLGSIEPGRRYYAAVTGAASDVFAVGAYNLSVAMSRPPGTGSPPAVVPPPAAAVPSAPPAASPSTPPPNTVVPPSGPIYPTTLFVAPDRFEVNNSIGTATRIGRISQVGVAGLTLPAGDVDFFSFQAAGQGVVQVSARGTAIQVLNNRGRVVARGTDSVAVSAARNASLIVRLQSVGTSSVADYTLTIVQSTPARRPPFRRPMGRQEAPPRPQALYATEGPVWAHHLKSAAV